MNATINAIFYKSKTLSSDEYPLMVRIAKSEKKTYRSLGVSIDQNTGILSEINLKETMYIRRKLSAILQLKNLNIKKAILKLNSIQKEYTTNS